MFWAEYEQLQLRFYQLTLLYFFENENPRLIVLLIVQARLWVQVLRDMRTGVKLKKVEFTKTPIEYEMTPYEILMDDIK